MATNYDFRILIDTVSGSQYSYGTGSFVTLNNTEVLLTTSESARIINNMPSMTYYNGKTFTTGSDLFQSKDPATFSDTNIDGSGVDYRFVSCSVIGNQDSGSLKFSINEAFTAGGDHTKRYKFFGNKVCSVLGLPENYWIYSDSFRLSNTGSEANYLSGDLLAQSVNVKHNFAISNAGSIETDLPFKHAKDSDRWVKWTDVSGSLPTNDMMLGYSNLNDRYELRMQNKDPFIIDSPNINLSGSATASGEFLVIKDVDGGSSQITIINQNNDSGTDKTAGIEFRHGAAHISANNIHGPAAKIEAKKVDSYSTVLTTRSSDLVFKTAYRNNLSEEMRLTSQGKLGIGTDTPGEALEVVGNISASGTIHASEIFGADDGNTGVPIVLSTQTGSFLTDVTSVNQGAVRKTTSGATGISGDISLGLATTDNVLFNHISASGDVFISGSGKIYLNNGKTSYIDNDNLTLTTTGDSINIQSGLTGVDSNQPWIASNGSFSILLDATNSSNTDFFNIRKNAANPISSAEIFKIADNGDITASGQFSGDGGYAKLPNSYPFRGVSIQATTENQYFAFGFSNEADNATAVNNRIIAAYDGHVERAVVRSKAAVGLTKYRMWRTTTGENPDLTDDGSTSNNDATSYDDTYQLGDTVEVTYSGTNLSKIVSFGTGYTFSAGDVLSISALIENGDSGGEWDGVLVLMYNVL
mgnify:CR=1 FL=1